MGNLVRKAGEIKLGAAMSGKRTKWDNAAEHAVLVKLHHGYRLTRKDHFTLAKIYEVHGPSSVYMAMGNLSGSLRHIGKGLAQAAKERGSRKKSTRPA